MRVLLAACLALSACSSSTEKAEHEKPEEKTPPPVFVCSGGPDCAIIGAAMLIYTAAATPATRAERKLLSRALFGRCEILVQDEAAPATKVAGQPCSQV